MWFAFYIPRHDTCMIKSPTFVVVNRLFFFFFFKGNIFLTFMIGKLYHIVSIFLLLMLKHARPFFEVPLRHP